MNEDKIIEIFVAVDDFYLQYADEIKQFQLHSGKVSKRNRPCKLSDSEIMCILISYHHSHYVDFKAFYKQYVCKHLTHLFPDLVSYERFNHLQGRVMVAMMFYLKHYAMGRSRGINFIDSTSIAACHIKREKQHRVLKEFAAKGKGTLGWFYGFKLHLIINDKGEILSFYLTKGNVDDRDLKVMGSLTQNIFGKLYGDRGYISQALADFLWNDGIHLVYKRRRNMKQQNLSDEDKVLLRKRALIESVNDELKNICNLQHTRHRSPKGFLINTIAALTAYQFLDKKPSLRIVPEKNDSKQLMIAA